MPIYATTEAKEFWDSSISARARSLAASRFCHLKTAANGSTDDEYRKKSALGIKKGAVVAGAPERFSNFISLLEAQGASVVFGKLEGRMILNSSGGVVENGGICLDRNSGIPYIPGSTVKGCARRFAVWDLSQTDDVDQKAEKLARLCLVFGYGDIEWNPGRDLKKGHCHSDFWLAMVPLEDTGPEHDSLRDRTWKDASERAQRIIIDKLGMKNLPRQLQGCVSFLPAFPEKDPGIDLDILTCHHPDYYEGKKKTATDDENPNPVVFPAVAKGGTFRFPLRPIRPRCSDDLLASTSGFLSEGLQQFGLGGKTNAGYGWFSMDSEAAKRAKNEREVAELAQSGPDEAAFAEIKAMHEKGQLVTKLNAYSFDEKFWPPDTSVGFELSLFEFVKSEASDLAASKKGKKAMENLAAKLKRPFP
ncbi:MAG: type III-B CRISPR module RAMP protein Cmr6 [Verrucomicrobiota bacterium JB025]|nr:type III-B CRISPR module RAMP protein Cmr6 [Verrucomicrobiota bacterium JB025]